MTLLELQKILGETIEAVTRLQVMRSAAEEAAKSGQSQIGVPVAINVRGVGRMGNAESGWHFAGMPAFSTVEIVTANATYPRFKAEASASRAASAVSRPGSMSATSGPIRSAMMGAMSG